MQQDFGIKPAYIIDAYKCTQVFAHKINKAATHHRFDPGEMVVVKIQVTPNPLVELRGAGLIFRLRFSAKIIF
jgi:hypothetical protein